jgi:hypothetical protein
VSAVNAIDVRALHLRSADAGAFWCDACPPSAFGNGVFHGAGKKPLPNKLLAASIEVKSQVPLSSFMTDFRGKS